MQPTNKQEIKNKQIICKTLASVIQKHKKCQNKTIYALAAEVGMSENTWGLVEKAQTLNPSIMTLWKIAEALDIRIEDLIKEVHDQLGDDFSLSGLN